MTTPLLLHEVSPRDGLQNEKTVVNTADKIQLLQQLAAAGPDSLEVTSFVRVDKVPQFADADELCQALRAVPWRQDLPLVGLVLNRHGYARFRESGLDAITAVIGAHEGFSMANSGMSIERAVEVNRELCRNAAADGFPVRLYLSMAFGSPQDGDTDPAAVEDLVAAAADMGVERVVLSDTVGVGRVDQVEDLLQRAHRHLPLESLALHMHDTYGRALENCVAGMRFGLQRFDASAGGTGGCPFAPGAAGNLATGALLQAAADFGLEVGVDGAAVDAAAAHLGQVLGRELAQGASRGPTR